MDLQYLRKLVKIFDESKATELVLEEEGLKLKLAKKDKNSFSIPSQHNVGELFPQVSLSTHQNTANPQQVSESYSTETKIEERSKDSDNLEIEEQLHKIYSPLVGTFYRAPSPDSEPFVQVGSHVNPGTTLCIIEAMKLMNELESDVSGTIVKILQENGQPVEYNQLLFLVKPD